MLKQIRIWFEKKGTAKYISHLDLNRTMSRAIRRARLPVWHTQGFNPHPHIVFSLPAPLGIECCKESMDVKLIEDMTFDEVESRLNSQLPVGLKILDVAEPKMKISEIGYAKYNIGFVLEGKTGQEVCQMIEKCLGEGELVVEKKTKSKTVKVDLMTKIAEHKLWDLPDRVCLTIVLPAGSKDNINPSLLVGAFEEVLGVDFSLVEIVREGLLAGKMQDFS